MLDSGTHYTIGTCVHKPFSTFKQEIPPGGAFETFFVNGRAMPARASWKGFLRINQLTVPVKAFTACRTDPDIPLHELHRGCHQRVRRQKYCPVHGVLELEDILSGYEVGEGSYLPIEPADLEELLPADNKSIAVDCFVPSTKVDPVHHSGRTYYLVPDELPGQRPFCVLRDGMRTTGHHAVARVVIGRRERTVVLRPLGKLVAMTVLEYTQRVRPAEDYEGEVAALSSGPTEQELISQLIRSMTNDYLDLERFRDAYVDGLSRLIEQRLATIEPATIQPHRPEEQDEAALIAALRASLAAAGADQGSLPPLLPPRHATDELGSARKLG